MLEIKIKDTTYTGKHILKETTLSELEACLNIANKKETFDYDYVDKTADILSIITDIPNDILLNISINEIKRIYDKLSDDNEVETKTLKGTITIGDETFILYNTNGQDQDFTEYEIYRGPFKRIRKAFADKKPDWIKRALASMYSNDQEEYIQLVRLLKQNDFETGIFLPVILKVIETVAIQTGEEYNIYSKLDENKPNENESKKEV